MGPDVIARAARRLGWNWASGMAVGLAGGVALTLVTLSLVDSDAPPKPEPGTIQVLSGLDVSEGRQRGQLVEQWNQLHPEGPRAQIVEMTGDADEQYSQVRATAQDGRSVPAAERVDVYNLDVTWTAEFAEAGHLLELDTDEVDTSGFLPGPLASGAHDGEQYGLPFNTDAGLLYYRADLISEPPSTWDELAAMTEQVLSDPAIRAAHPELEAGIALQLADYEGFSVNLLEWTLAHGGDLGDGETSRVADDADTVVALEELDARFAQPGSAPLILPDALRHKEADSLAAFAAGRTLFLRQWPYAYRELARTDLAECGTAQKSFCVARLPGPGVLGGQNLAVSAYTDQPAAAVALVEFLTSERSQQLLFERGGFGATRQVVYRDPVIVREHPYAALLLDAVTNARARPETAAYQRYSETLRSTLHRALSVPERADLADLQARLNEVLE
ncbi:extracellular solute-binding protein [Phytomonospora sp. NPDC050363]|uniref:extracellular solute-binding protein n=1 Tax=Phytomonospora sp. NPDC050363 TaxID=3155642 RepID=UPI0034077146